MKRQNGTQTLDQYFQTKRTKFDVDTTPTYTPLAERVRPQKLEDLIGQEKALGEGTPFYAMIANNQISSTIIYGPAGCGKTTIAKIIARTTKNDFVTVSATSTGKNELKDIIKTATQKKKMGTNTILFVDEIHSLNKLQQDTFLPAVENGNIILLGATTENPSFEINDALMSRCGLLVLRRLRDEDLMTIMKNAIEKEYKGCMFELSDEVFQYIASVADGDGRNALNFVEKVYLYYTKFNIDQLEKIVLASKKTEKTATTVEKGCRDVVNRDNEKSVVVERETHQNVTQEDTKEVKDMKDDINEKHKSSDEVQNLKEKGIETLMDNQTTKVILTLDIILAFLERTKYSYDKKGESHYNLISALHKSMRGSDENAALYWLHRMVLAGENPKYIARRLIRFSSEDIGLADTNALTVAVNTFQAVNVMGYPECDVVLSECVLYLSRAPKSVCAYKAMKTTQQLIKDTGCLPVPMNIRNAATNLMGKMGYGEGYLYPPMFDHVLQQSYLPKEIEGKELVTYDKFVKKLKKEDVISSKSIEDGFFESVGGW
ncbi:werner helicase interacting protein, putative [Entamoeba invadens IP1]|uniref:Werner helicase interacting protein, putative n=1 Tax=Entamoeba invadens IP1 TaxID=370355 RepID=A0A0A1UGQ4_ENTIV|nr:werner helicase interacting protein, putative [Entamoeba invadens IP1]ELP92928.1 werner helicase interacting protein, putative [Entamoeba invadens IP1]|eukprot:XP_004259699.1 werner helicase interacting protein, putative [Entamoeba invadens IP1]